MLSQVTTAISNYLPEYTVSSQMALPGGIPNLNLELDRNYREFLALLGKYLVNILFNGGTWPVCLNIAFLKLIFLEDLEPSDLQHIDYEAFVSNDLRTEIVDGHNGPLAKCSAKIRFNYQHVLTCFVEDGVHDEDEQARIWKLRLVEHFALVMEQSVSHVRENLSFVTELGLRYSVVEVPYKS